MNKLRFSQFARKNTHKIWYEGPVTQLDETGLFVVTDHEYPEGSLLDARLFLDNTKDTVPLHIECKVLWLASKRVHERDIHGMQVGFFYKQWKDYRYIRRQLASHHAFLHMWKTHYVSLLLWSLVGLLLIIFIVNQYHYG